MQRDIKIDTIIMDNFYKLVHSQPNIRLTAASSTYKILNTMKNKRPQVFNENLNYCIERLVAGLASSRAQARRGYGTLLLELLKSYHVSTERLLTIAEKKFAHISKETSRDNLLAYFLLISIILESGNYKRTKGNSQYLERIFKCLLQLQNTKSYLEYPVSKILVEYREPLYQFMVASIPAHAFESDFRVSAIELLMITLCHKQELIRKIASLDSNELINLCSVLLEEKFQKRPLHPVFLEASRLVIENFKQHFATFYNQILQPTFFKANHNELAAMGLELTAALIEIADDTVTISNLLNPHVIRMLILSVRNNTSMKTHVNKFFSSLQNLFKDKLSGDMQFAVIDALTNSPGSIEFDEDSKSSSLRNLLQNCNHDSLVKYLDKLMKVMKNPKKDELQSSAKQIAFLVKRPQFIEDQVTLKKVAKYFLTRIISGDSLKEQTLASFKNAYHAILDQIVSVPLTQQRIEHLNDLVELYDQQSGQTNELWPVYKASLKEYRKLIKKHEDPKILYPITTLFLFYGLQVIEHELDCKEQLEELIQTSKEAIKGDNEDNSWADILTDQIIAILSATECKPWIRKLCEKVFSSLVSHTSDTSVDLICDAIKAPYPGDEEEEVDDEEEEEEDEEQSDTSDSEDGEELDGETEEADESAMDVDEETSDQEGEMTQVQTGVSSAKISAHTNGNSDGEHSNKSDEEEADDDDDEEEAEEYLDDEQMMKLDSVLADMFKLNRKKRPDPSFKLRCLDLIRILLKKHKNAEVINTVLATLLPLYSSSRKFAETRPISDKIVGLLGKMQGKSRYPKVVEFLDRQQQRKEKRKKKTSQTGKESVAVE